MFDIKYLNKCEKPVLNVGDKLHVFIITLHLVDITSQVLQHSIHCAVVYQSINISGTRSIKLNIFNSE